MKWYIAVDFTLCAVLYIIMAVTGLQDEVPMACLGKGVIWSVFAICGLKFTSFVNPSMCFTFIESYRLRLREIFTSRRASMKKIQKSKNHESRDEDEEICRSTCNYGCRLFLWFERHGEMPNFVQSLLLLYTQTSLRYFEHLLFKPWFYRNNFLMPHLIVPMPKSYVTATVFDFMGRQI